MRTALDAPASTLDADEANFVANIRTHGWFGTSVFADDEGPDFTYTTGFWVNLGLPEIILFSLGSKISHAVLWDVYRDVKDGRQIPAGTFVPSIFANGGAYFFPVGRQRYPDYLGWSRWFYGGDNFPCLQLVWGDTNGVFPWQAEFEDRFKSKQPDVSAQGWTKHLTQ